MKIARGLTVVMRRRVAPRHRILLLVLLCKAFRYRRWPRVGIALACGSYGKTPRAATMAFKCSYKG